MPNLRFILFGCLIFFIGGPLVPLLAFGSLNPASLILAPFAYFFGGLTAMGFGLVFSLTSIPITRVFARFVLGARPSSLALAGAALGFAVCAVLIVLPAIWLTLRSPALSQMKLNTVSHWLQSEAPGHLLGMFILPTMVCGAIVWVWLVPRLMRQTNSGAA